MLDAAMYKPLSYRDADRLVDVHTIAGVVDGEEFAIATRGKNADDLRAIPQVFEDVSAFSPSTEEFSSPFDSPTEAGRLAPGLVEFLGVSPRLGRAFSLQDIGVKVALISDGHWNSVFSRDPGALGQTIRLADGAYTVIGIMPPEFRYLVGADTQVWRPVAEAESAQVVARLRPGLSLPAAQALVNSALADPNSAWKPRGLRLRPVEWNRGRESVRTMLLLLLGSVGLLLILACANVANLLLAQALDRQQEVAIRTSLGATRAQLVRQFLIEGLVLAAIGGVASILVARLCQLILSSVPQDLVSTILGTWVPTIDMRILLVALAATALSGAACAIAPALRASHARPGRQLAASQRVGPSVGQLQLGRVLQMLQVALSVVLLAGASVLGQAFLRLARQPPGFNSIGLAYVGLHYPGGTRVSTRRTLNEELLARIAAVPGVQGALHGPDPSRGYTGGQILPVAASTGSESVGSADYLLEYFPVRPGYFEMTGIPITAGRAFQPEDVTDDPSVAIISQDAAARFWPGQSAVGQRFIKYKGADPLTVVGVAGRTRTSEKAKDAPVIYEVLGRQSAAFGLVFRTQGKPEPVFRSIVALVQSMATGVSVEEIGLVDDLYEKDDPLAASRFYATITAALAALGLAIAAVGLFALLSHAVGRRIREIGIRMALGARRGTVQFTVLVDALAPVGVGLAVGLVLASILTRLLAAQVPTVKPNDPLALAFVMIVFAVFAIAAAIGPVRRATRVDPIVALKTE